MKKQKKDKKEECKMPATCSGDMCKNGAIYGLGVLGAAIYYIQTATGFWAGVWGIVKAFLWPAFGIYELFKFLGM